ncbi:hypothetical protein V2A60_003476 [Cordyceps javanica]
MLKPVVGVVVLTFVIEVVFDSKTEVDDALPGIVCCVVVLRLGVEERLLVECEADEGSEEDVCELLDALDVIDMLDCVVDAVDVVVREVSELVWDGVRIEEAASLDEDWEDDIKEVVEDLLLGFGAGCIAIEELLVMA